MDREKFDSLQVGDVITSIAYKSSNPFVITQAWVSKTGRNEYYARSLTHTEHGNFIVLVPHNWEIYRRRKCNV